MWRVMVRIPLVRGRSAGAGDVIRRPSYPWRGIAVGALVVLAAAVTAAGVGAIGLPPLDVVKITAARLPFIDLPQTWPDTWETIVWQVRLPRIALAGIVGAALSMSGAAYQGLFRNPLADPYLIGVSAGAGLGAVVILVAGAGNIGMLPIAAYVGGLGAVLAAYLAARRSGGVPLTTLILAGVAVSSLASALTAFLMIRSDPDLRPVLSWLLGGFASAQWMHVGLMIPYFLPCAALIFAYSRVMNVMQLDEEHAWQLGVNVGRTKALLIAAASLATAAAVSFSGLIGFVGLIAPHVARMLWGVDYRSLLPLSMLLGAGFLILADMAARTAVSPAELPVGIVTAFCGAPFFLYLLRRRQVEM